jgi:hypothetical protein
MPDDYQNLFNELSGLPAANNDAGANVPAPELVADLNLTPGEGDAAPADVNLPVPEAPVVPEDVKNTPEPTPAVPEPTSRAFAEQRAQIAKYQKVFKQMQETMG